jgi:hypothetical protein
LSLLLLTKIVGLNWQGKLIHNSTQILLNERSSNSQLGSGGRHFSFFLLPYSFLPRRFPAATREAAPKNEAGKGKNEEFQLRLRIAVKGEIYAFT